MLNKKLKEQDHPLNNIGDIIQEDGTEKDSLIAARHKRTVAEKFTFMLYEDQIEWIDELLKDARKEGGKRLRRPEVLRPILDYMQMVGLDLRGVQSELEVIGRIEEAIKEKYERQ